MLQWPVRDLWWRQSEVSARRQLTACALYLLFGPGLLLAALFLTGCATPYHMMPTPVLYTGKQAEPLFTNVSATHRTPSLDLLYVTDRASSSDANDINPYSSGRSRQVAFGTTTVAFGDALTWDALVAQSTVADREVPVVLKLGTTKELGRFPPIPYELADQSRGHHTQSSHRRRA